jgi:hypothetical protein
MLATKESKKIQTAAAGHGPLWQRDYWVEIAQSTLSPEEVVLMLRREFPTFSPDEAAKFTRLDGKSTPLEAGDEMEVEIRGAGTSEVRVVGVTPRSLTMRTIEGHLEAGRISFGAYYDKDKTVIRVRSKARSGSRRRHVAYILMGHVMQKKVWQVFIARVAARCGDENAQVQTSTAQVRGDLADLGELDTPTFTTDDRF